MARGSLRVYLGAAPGVGKTYAMLGEGRRKGERGADVVVAFVETHGREKTAAMVGDLEVVARREISYRGSVFSEMDVDAVLARRPELALVDELAHTNVPGSRNARRWEDVEELLGAGINVLSTVNIQHLESLNDVVERITGVRQRETIPDEVVRRADQIELVDMSPEALRRRMAHGNIYRAESVDAALSNYFRVGNLTALREMALLWVADRVDEVLTRYRAEHHIGGVWEARERIVVALTGGPEGETLIRRAARIAARTAGAELHAVHAIRGDGLVGARPEQIARQRRLLEDLGGIFHTVVGDDVPAAILDFARGVNATQIVIGASRRSRYGRMLREGIGATIIRESGPIDVHLVTHERAGRGLSLPRVSAGLTRKRRLAGILVTALLLPALTLGMLPFRDSISLASEVIAFFLAVVVVSLIGGIWPALLCAVAGFLLLNWFFTPPTGTFTIAGTENLLALASMVIVALAVSWVVELSAQRTALAARARAEATLLASLAGSVLRGDDPLRTLLDRVREAFGMRSATLLERIGTGWEPAASAGGPPCLRPEDGDVDVPVDDDVRLVLCGRVLPASDQRVLATVAEQAAVALRQRRLSERARLAAELENATNLRTALLRALGHDLRTPLAGIKAAASSLRSSEVDFSETDRADLVAGIETSVDQLTDLVGNLLDLTRITAGAVDPLLRPIGLEEIVPRALAGVPPDAKITIDVPESLPEVLVDPGLLERVLANLISNAVRHGGPDHPVQVRGSAHGDRVELRVCDRGPGIAPADRERVFEPFQRLGDRDTTTGVGLGLAVARGFTEALGGTLTPEETPGGGLTMTLSLPAAGR